MTLQDICAVNRASFYPLGERRSTGWVGKVENRGKRQPRRTASRLCPSTRREALEVANKFADQIGFTGGVFQLRAECMPALLGLFLGDVD
ncbi:unnamed protein product [Dibothriocephalus latus]|uniref:Uncharacterized protein n=1 Tax=Dibothriocephalus latus TaxID=60516 RepID=A0A3P7LX67_DIBLA|nr:unnamed protein product [Dibothriocephalus latus]